MATSAASALSFQGLSSGIQTDALVSAILAQDSQGLLALQARQTRNNQKTTALTAMKANMTAVYMSLATIQDQLNGRTVTSTDINNTYATATASGAAAGNYDLTVSTVATKGRISSTMDAGGNPNNLAVNNLTDKISDAGAATFEIQGTDGVVKEIKLDATNNTLAGLRDAINNSGAGVTASIVNNGMAGTGADGKPILLADGVTTVKPFQLVLTAKATGAGSTNGVVTIADVTNGAGGPTANNLGILAGSVVLDAKSNPTGITGGSTSDQFGVTGTNATFTLNGIALTRQSNVVSDAADGVTFTLLQGGQKGTTTLTVAQNATTATAGLQDLITKFNALVTAYTTAKGTTKNADGSITKGPLSDDLVSRSMMSQVRAALTGVSPGMTVGAPYSSLANLGVKTNADGTLSLSTSTFQAALKADPVAVMNLFTTGSGLATSKLISTLSSSANGPLATALKTITTNNTSLANQIQGQQSALAKQKRILQKQFSDMEVAVAQMKASAGSLLGA